MLEGVLPASRFLFARRALALTNKFSFARGAPANKFLCFGNEASRDRFVGRSVGRLVSLYDINFKKGPKMIYVPVDCLLIQLQGRVAKTR